MTNLTPNSSLGTVTISPVSDQISITDTPTPLVAVKPSGVFTPFSREDIGDYSARNWEALEGDLVISHVSAKEVNRPLVATNANMQSNWLLGNSDPVESRPAENDSNQSGIDHRFFGRTSWGILLNQLRLIALFVQDAMRLTIPSASSPPSPLLKPIIAAKFQDFYMKKIFATDLPNYPDFQFSEHVHLFIRHFEAMEIRSKLADLTGPTSPLRTREVVDEMHHELFMSLTTNICEEGHGAGFKKHYRERQSNIQRNIQKNCNYVDAILERNFPILVLRIDLEYTYAAVQCLTIGQVQNDLKKFMNNRRRKKLISGENGYIWKLENSDRRGLHFHMIFFFTDSGVTQQQFLTQQIGEYWMKSTGLRGSYQDCSKSDYPYKRLGIGRMSKDDAKKRADLRSVVTYLCKRDQALSVKDVQVISHGMKTKSRVNESPHLLFGETRL